MNETQDQMPALSVKSDILSTPQKAQRSTTIQPVTVVVSAVAGAVIAILIAIFLPAFLKYLSHGNPWVFALAALLGLYFVLVTHEFGHLLAGRLVGFRFLLLIVGPLKVTRDQRGIRISFNTHMALLGLTAFLPSNDLNLPRKTFITVACGPLASLLLTVLAAASYAFTPSETFYPVLPDILLLIALFSLIIFIITIIPADVSGFLTDGARMLMLAKSGPLVERWTDLWVLRSASFGGQLPREWNVSRVQRATSLPDGSLDDVVGCILGYYYALDTGDIATAQSYLERSLAVLLHTPRTLRAGLALEAAYFEARYHHNAVAARSWLKESSAVFFDVCTKARVDAAILLAEGKQEEARARIDEGLAAVKNATHAGTGRLEEVLLKALLLDYNT